MIDINSSIGQLKNYAKKSNEILIRFVNLSDANENVPVTYITFNKSGNILAIGDKIGRISIICFFRIIVYVRLDIINDINNHKYQQQLNNLNTKKDIVPIIMSSEIDSICLEEKIISADSNAYLSNTIKDHRTYYMIVSFNSLIIIYCGKVPRPKLIKILPSIHRSRVYYLNLLQMKHMHSFDSDQDQYLLSSSLDTVIIWDMVNHSPLWKLDCDQFLSSKSTCSLICSSIYLNHNVDAIKKNSFQFNLNSFQSLNNPFIAVLLEKNVIMIWHVHKKCKNMATIKEKDWKHFLLDKLSHDQNNIKNPEVTLSIITSQSTPTYIPTFQTYLCVAGSLIFYNKTLSKSECQKGLIILFKPSNQSKEFFSLRNLSNNNVNLEIIPFTPLQCQLSTFLTRSKKSTLSPEHIPTTYIAILLQNYTVQVLCLGIIYLRSLQIRNIHTFSNILCQIYPLSVEKFQNSQINFPSVTISSNVVHQSDTNIVLFSIDNASKYIVLGLADGSVQIMSTRYYLKNFDVFFKQNIRQRNENVYLEPNSLLMEQEKYKSNISLTTDCAINEDILSPVLSDHSRKYDESLSDNCMLNLDFPSDTSSIWSEKSIDQLDFDNRDEINQKLLIDNYTSPLNDLFNKTTSPNIASKYSIENGQNTPNMIEENLNNGIVLHSQNYFDYNIKNVSIESLLVTFMNHHFNASYNKIKVPFPIMWLCNRTKTLLYQTTMHLQCKLSLLKTTQPTHEELRSMYLMNDPYRYTDTYRESFWEYILELPKNQSAFSTFVKAMEKDGGEHPFYVNFRNLYYLKDELVFKRLKKLLGYIAYWCPSLKEVDWISQLVFGITVVCGPRLLFGFELFLIIILWWSYLGCRSFYTVPSFFPCNTLLENNFCTIEEQPSLDVTIDNVSNNQPNHFLSANLPKSLNGWSWFSQISLNSPPMYLCIFSSYTLFREDSILWCHMLLHWDILSLLEQNQLKYQIMNYNLYDKSLMRNDTPSSVEVNDLHFRLGCRILWPLIRSWLSEVYEYYYICTFWDHFISNPLRPFLPLAASVATLISYRLTLLSINNFSSYFKWMTSPRVTKIQEVLEKMYSIDHNISSLYINEIAVENIDSIKELSIGLSDMGWPIWTFNYDIKDSDTILTSKSKKLMKSKNPKMSGLCYPELILDVHDVNLPESYQITSLLNFNQNLEEKRTYLIESLRKIYDNGSNDSQSFTAPSISKNSEEVFQMIENLINLEDEMDKQSKIKMWISRELSIDKENSMLRSNDYHHDWQKDIFIRQKLLEFYEKCINSLNNRLPSNKLSESHMCNISKKLFDSLEASLKICTQSNTLMNFVNDIDLLHKVKYNGDALNLYKERIEQRKRVLEEETRTLKSRYQSTSTFSLPSVDLKTLPNDSKIPKNSITFDDSIEKENIIPDNVSKIDSFSEVNEDMYDKNKDRFLLEHKNDSFCEVSILNVENTSNNILVNPQLNIPPKIIEKLISSLRKGRKRFNKHNKKKII